jgi:hypothetical protein
MRASWRDDRLLLLFAAAVVALTALTLAGVL